MRSDARTEISMDGLCSGLPADDCEIYALAGERIDEAARISY